MGQEGGMELRCDNQGGIATARNLEGNSGRTKHIDIRQMWIKEAVEMGEVKLQYVKSEDNVADILTKALGGDLFRKHRRAMGIT
jgi:hypothetical protein